MRLMLVIAAALTLTGCTTTQERLTANNQMAVEPQIYNQMVLENLVNIMGNPATMPYFATLDSGIPQVADSGSFGGFWTFMPQTLVKQLHNQHGGQVGPLTGSRSIQSNWTLKPVNDDNRLKAMRCLYMWVLGHPEVNTKECQDQLNKYFPPDHAGMPTFNVAMIQPGWLHCGPWHERPKNACYFVYKHLTAYWVDPAYEEDFAKLTLAILRIALQAQRTMTVKTFTYDANNKLICEETRTSAYKPLKTKKPSDADVGAYVKAMVPDIAKAITQTEIDNAIKAANEQAPIKEMTDAQKELRSLLPSSVAELVRGAMRKLPSAASVDAVKVATHDAITNIPRDLNINQGLKLELNQSPIVPAHLWEELDKAIIATARQADSDLTEQQRVLNELPDPELKIDTFSNPEISPGLITLPH